MPRKLKVFRAHLGFYDTVVAVPSKKAALEAWGSRQDLFREGFAALSEEPDAVRDALASPGVVLRRPFGSKDRFSENPGLPKVTGPAPARKRASTARKKAEEEKRQQQAELRRLAEQRRRQRDEEAAARERLAEQRRLQREEELALRQLEKKREELAREEAEIRRRFAGRRGKPGR